MKIAWKIEQMNRQVANGGIVTAYWRAIGTEDGHSATSYGSCSFAPDPTSDDFIAYDDLNEYVVLRWVWEQINQDDIEAALIAQIDQLKNPVEAYGVPWHDAGPLP